MKIRRVKTEQCGAVSVDCLVRIVFGDSSGCRTGTLIIPKGVCYAEGAPGYSAGAKALYVIEGAFNVRTEAGDQRVEAGDLIVMDPDECHETTALENSRLLYVATSQKTALNPTAISRGWPVVTSPFDALPTSISRSSKFSPKT